MTLDDNQIKQFVLFPYSADKIAKATVINRKLDAHINGYEVESYLEIIDKYESPDDLALRKKLVTSNRSLCSDIYKPIEKIYSARGGGVDYQIEASKEQEFKDKLKNVAKGQSVRGWVRSQWQPRYMTDPFGVILFETKSNETYPTYKSIKVIHDIQFDGQEVEYLILKKEATKQQKSDGYTVYRFIDDTRDIIVFKKGDVVTVDTVESESFETVYEKIPAIVISDIEDPITEIPKSRAEDVVEVLDDVLIDCSIKNVFKKKHGFPLWWAYLPDCPVCGGEKEIDGVKCTSCKGTGKDINKNVSTVWGLEQPGKDDQKITPDLSGYVVPPEFTLPQMWEAEDRFRKKLWYTTWGSHLQDSTGTETATGIFLNIQPVYDTLFYYSSAAEKIEKFITDRIGEFYYNTEGTNLYKGSTIKYGRRYLVESPKDILNEYNLNREKGSSDVLLNYLIAQYYYSMFKNDETELQKYIILMNFEPFIHLTVSQVTGLPLGDKEKKRKIFFNEWVRTLTTNEIIDSKDKLGELLDKYIINLKLKSNERE